MNVKYSRREYMGANYTYDDVLEGGTVRNPMEGPTQPQTNEYTNNTIRDSLNPNDPQHNNGAGSVLNGEDNDYYNGPGY